MKKEHIKAKKRPAESIVDVPEKKLKKTRQDGKTPKTAKVKLDGVEKTLANLEVTNEHVAKCVDAILKLVEKNANKTSLLSDDSKIFLLIHCIKIPKVPQRNLRLLLPHIMIGANDDVALIVPDLVKGRRQDYEKTIDHWETKLEQCDITRIKDILPMNKIKTEYNQYEMRRKLARLYDVFLIDGRIAGHMTHLLGSTFRRFANPPVPIKLHRDNLKGEIETGLKKSTLEIHGKGNSHSVQVATSSMSKQTIIDNVMAACKEIENKYPGGLDNIRAIFIKPQFGLSIPIYYSIKNKNQVNVPVVAPKRPKAFKTVEGELSTMVSDVIAKVEPGGHVKIVRNGDVTADEEMEITTEGKEDGKKIKRKKENRVKSKNIKTDKIKKVSNSVKVKNIKTAKIKKVESNEEESNNIKTEEKIIKKKKNVQLKKDDIKNAPIDTAEGNKKLVIKKNGKTIERPIKKEKKVPVKIKKVALKEKNMKVKKNQLETKIKKEKSVQLKKQKK